MINIDKQILSGILERYGIIDRIVDFSPVINAQVEEKTRLKIIIKVNLENGDSVIVKIVKEEEHPTEIINQQSVFSQTLLRCGISVPERYVSVNGDYCYTETICGYSCSITVEEFLLGKELEVINEGYVKELARIMANMHMVSQANNCHINIGTIWNIFDPNADILQGYQHYLSLYDEYRSSGMDVGKYHAISKTYIKKKNRLQKIWGDLPKYAVQGDFSTNNVIINDDGTINGLVDFNIAGDEVLVNDMVTQGIFICYIMDLDRGLTEEDRKALFDKFISQYMQMRALSEIEISVMNEIYSIVFPFLWTRIEYFETLLKDGAIEDANRFLNETWKLLTTPYFVF